VAIPFYYNPATNELELTADPSPLRDSLGTRFGLNEISTRAKPLSPIKSHTAEPIIPSQFDELSFEEMEDIKKQVKFGEQVKDGGRIGFDEGKRVTIEPNIRESTTTGTYFVDKKGIRNSFDTLEEARKFIKKIEQELGQRVGIGRDISSELLQEIKNSYLKGNSALTISKNLIERYPNKIGISASTIDSVLTKLKTEAVNKVPKFTKTELKNKPDIRGINQFVAVALDPNKIEAIKKDAKTLSKTEIIKNHNVSIQSLINLEKKGLVKFPIRGVGKPPFKAHVTADAETVLKMLKSDPALTTAAIKTQTGWSVTKTSAAIKALKSIIEPKAGAVRTGLTIEKDLIKTVKNLKAAVSTTEEELLKSGVKKSEVDKIMRSRKAVSEFFPGGTNFEHHLPRNLISYIKDKDLRAQLEVTGSRTSPELNQFKLRYDRLMKGIIDEFIGSNGTSKDLALYNKKRDNIRSIVKKATGGYEIGYLKFDLNKKATPVLFAKNIEQGTRALGPETYQKLQSFGNAKFTNTLLKNYKNNPDNEIYSTLKKYKPVKELSTDYVNRYETLAKEYNKIKPYLSSREKIISFAKKNLNNPVIKALFKKSYGKFGLALTTAALLPSALAAEELDPSDKEQEASVGEGAAAIAAGTIAAKYPQEIWEGGKKGLKWAAEKLAPIMLPGPSHILHGGKYDLTSGSDLSTMAFWKHAADWTGKTSKLGDATIPLKKRLKDLAWRGLLPTRFLPLISGAASVAAGPLLIKDAAEWLQGRLEKDNLTGKGGIADYAGIISDEAGGSLFIEDVVKEKQKQAAEGMDYAQGGIASLIK